jgi:uncharacterized protein YbjT (DUF2867 family)
MQRAARSPSSPVTVFGGTGFLGRRIVHHLEKAGFCVRIASRHPDRARQLFSESDNCIRSIRADVNDGTAIAAVVEGSAAVVNAVSLYVEHGKDSFRSVHVDAAALVARQAAAAGVERLVHLSGIGADTGSSSSYIRNRGEGEAAVLRAFRSAVVIRPSVMFGPDDAFLVPLLSMMRRTPIFPLFGSGETQLQPVYVGDVAVAIAHILTLPTVERIYELAGPRIYTYRELIRAIGAALHKQPVLLPVPFALWKVGASMAELTRSAPITRNQVELMEQDNTASGSRPGFAQLQMAIRPLDELLRSMAAGLAPGDEPRRSAGL